jgi:hypothetical protein
MGIVALAELDPKPLAQPLAKGLQIELSPEEYTIGLEPPLLPDRPVVKGALWKSYLYLAHLTSQEHEKVLGMLTKHRNMWDGRSGQVHSTEHRIKLTSGANPAY